MLPIEESGMDMGKTLIGVLDGMEEKFRLPVWLRYGVKLDAGETAEVLGTSENVVRGLVDHGMSRMLDVLRKMGILTDERSVAAMISIMPHEPVPETLLDRIDVIVTGAPSPGPRERPDLSAGRFRGCGSPQGRGGLRQRRDLPANRFRERGSVACRFPRFCACRAGRRWN